MSETYFRLSTKPGWIEVITGCMFSGKSEELIRQIRRAELARQNVKVFKPKIDDRYSKDEVASHNNNKSPSIVIESPFEILQHVDLYTQVVGIDEAQFFSNEITAVAHQLAEEGKRVLVAGLDTDWRGKPFGPMPFLLAQAEVIHKQYAICMVCGEPATRTQRLVCDENDVLVGSTEAYEARCRRHFDPELSLRLEKTLNQFASKQNSDMDLQL